MLIKRVRVLGAEKLERNLCGRMGNQNLDQPFAQRLTTIVGVDDDIREPRERGPIRDNAREPDLPPRVIDPKGDRVLNAGRNCLSRSRLCPICVCKELTDAIQIKLRRVVRDKIVALNPLHGG